MRARLGVLGFSFKAILIKLAYAPQPIDPVTLLALRMLYSAPFFVAMVLVVRASRRGCADRKARLAADPGSASSATTCASLLDFIGLQHVTASPERLVLYPVSDDGRGALGARSQAAGDAARIAVRAACLSYAGIALPCSAAIIRSPATPRRRSVGSSRVRGRALGYAIYLVAAGRHHRAVSARRGSSHWAMLASAAFMLASSSRSTRPHVRAAQCRPTFTLLVARDGDVLRRCCPTLDDRRIGRAASARVPTSLIGSLGPVFTIWLRRACCSASPCNAMQLVGDGAGARRRDARVARRAQSGERRRA